LKTGDVLILHESDCNIVTHRLHRDSSVKERPTR